MPSVKDYHKELMDQVATLRTSQEWLDAMTAAAKFHSYSFGNWMLMWSQGQRRNMTITRPAGYRAWQALGRQVRKGEKGLKIFAPMAKKDDDGNTNVFGFRVATVFDISQTDGDPLPDIGSPVLLEGEGDTELRTACEAMIVDQGFTVQLLPLHGPNGSTNHTTKEVKIEEGISPAQATKTTIHELAHVLLHGSTLRAFDCRGRVEVEAESVAYVVCAAAGLDTSQYSVKYVAGWSEETDDPAKTMLATAEVVVRTARKILATISDRHELAAA
jgi:antirestriction protein ArdC